ncbi:hypothetical protein F7725_012792 [Dissostichus mawsoni]|uniref:Uncharacterized protein n=1 Tax=Dissostichus mawsoni TaxID=36200 RepID=A0A7J5YNQ4_DISMA|nr:hypothetical protein F7725_012792 [Dissostichus mawsoni]
MGKLKKNSVLCEKGARRETPSRTCWITRTEECSRFPGLGGDDVYGALRINGTGSLSQCQEEKKKIRLTLFSPLWAFDGSGESKGLTMISILFVLLFFSPLNGFISSRGQYSASQTKSREYTTKGHAAPWSSASFIIFL